MRLSQAALDTPLDSPFSATLSLHGLHFTVCALSTTPTKTMMNIASVILGMVYILLFSWVLTIRAPPPLKSFFDPKSFVVAVYGWWSPIEFNNELLQGGQGQLIALIALTLLFHSSLRAA